MYLLNFRRAKVMQASPCILSFSYPAEYLVITPTIKYTMYSISVWLKWYNSLTLKFCTVHHSTLGHISSANVLVEIKLYLFLIRSSGLNKMDK